MKHGKSKSINEGIYILYLYPYRYGTFLMLRIINESFFLLLALSLGVYTFRYMNIFHKIFFLQLFVYILFDIMANIVLIIQKTNNGILNNQWVYNLYMPIETGLLTWAVYEYFKSAKAKILLSIGYTVFMIVFVMEICIKGMRVLSNHAYFAESILLLIIFLLVLNSQFNQKSISWKKSSEVWISFGVVLYFTGVIPYFSLIHYLQESHPTTNLSLYYIIVEGLSDLRYLLLAYGFWLVRRNVLSKISGLNGRP